MKIDWNKKYTTIAVYAFLVLAGFSIFQMLLNNYEGVSQSLANVLGLLSPFFMGFCLAYILNFCLRFFENSFLKFFDRKGKLSEKSSRTLGICLTYFSFLIFIFLIIYLVMPGAVRSIRDLANNLPSYTNNLGLWMEEKINEYNIDHSYIRDLLNKGTDYVKNLDITLAGWLPKIGGFLSSTISGTMNLVMAIIISIYILIEKNRFLAQAKMLSYALLPKRAADYLMVIGKRFDSKMRQYFISQGLDSVIVGVIFFVIFMIMQVKYVGLMSFLMAITNMIPWIGPWLGTIPCILIILFQDPVKAFWFLPVVLIVQQLDGNVINPRIHGDSMGISAFWIVFAILVGGYFMGPVGMIVAIPIFAVFYSIVKELVEHLLAKKNLPTRSEDYKKSGEIDQVNNL